jgi:hypothetical protein
MMICHYFLWRLTQPEGPIMLVYVIMIAVVLTAIVEASDRMIKYFRKKKDKAS